MINKWFLETVERKIEFSQRIVLELSDYIDKHHNLTSNDHYTLDEMKNDIEISLDKLESARLKLKFQMKRGNEND